MILSKYPRVIQNEIFHNMKYSELLLLSFASNNMKKLIKLSQMKRFKAMGSIEYDTDRTDQPLVRIHRTDFKEKIIIIMKILEYEPRNDYFQLNVSGKKIDFRLCTEDRDEKSYPVAVYPKSEKQCVIESIHNHFLDFFGDSVEYVWKMDDDRYKFYIPFIPQLQNLSLCVNLLLGDDFADMENLENFLSSSPVMKSIFMDANTSNREPFNPESKLYQAQSIDIATHEPTFPAFLIHFQGRQAIIDCSICHTSDLIKFVNRWKSGEALRMLEYLRISVDMYEIPKNRLLRRIGAKTIDATKQPPVHQMPLIYDWCCLGPNTFPIKSYSYVVRESDNRVTSVQIHGLTFSFGVWDKTEEEFLRMMD
ncbi:unnamed protein product [Caenorhabditis nigoni]